MKRFAGFLVAGVALFFFSGCSAAQVAIAPTAPAIALAPQLSLKVIAVYPHDPTAFTEGLFFADNALYESTGLWQHSTLRKVDLQSGKVLWEHHLPDDVFGEGIALMKGKLVQLTWQKHMAYTYAFNDFHALGTLAYEGEGWGLTSDGASWISSNGSTTLTWRDAETFAPQRTVQVTWNGQPVDQLNELEWIDGVIWANVWHTNWILQIDASSGKVLSYLDISSLIPAGADPEDVPNGIAYDSTSKRIFITGKRWPKLYEIQVK